jgi:acetamidase/formamidase
VHRNGGPSSVIGTEDDPGFGVGSRAGYQVPGVTSGNPICEPVYVNGAEPGDTLQVDVLSLKTGPFGWTGDMSLAMHPLALAA